MLDLNAEMYFKNKEELSAILDVMDNTQILSDDWVLDSFYTKIDTYIDAHYAAIPWEEYPQVYVTPPSWCPTVPSEAVLRLSRAIRRVAPATKIFFFGNTLGTWTDEVDLNRNGVQTVHLNDLFASDATGKPVNYDLLPTPIYENRDKYLFDLLPFMVNHGCSWGRCKFCSIARGWNSGYADRTSSAVIKELSELIDRYDPAMLICTTSSLDGHSLIEFCGFVERFGKPWCAMSRAELPDKKMRALWKAGCRLLYFGLESGSDRVLQAMNKGITSNQMSEFIKRLDSKGILPVPSLIIGAPGEEEADFEKTIEFLTDHRPYLEAVNVYPFVPTPASDFSSQNKQPDKNMPLRLFQLFQACEELGLKAHVGEECMEYFLFKWIQNRGLTGA